MSLAKARAAVRRSGEELAVIGRVTGDKDRVVIKRKGRWIDIPDEGWTHLR